MTPEQALDFEANVPQDQEWWRQQDQELEQQELERLETQAEMEELRHNGYWD